MRVRVPFRERIWCSVEDACDVSGLRRTKIFEMIAAGELTSRREGRRRLVSVASILDRFGIKTEGWK
jgi:hypothetical protein